jgi:sec-independent protein translocase protein TatA
MPNLGFGEIVLIALVALILFGPRKLPELGRALGKAFHDFRKAMEGKPEETPPAQEEKTS